MKKIYLVTSILLLLSSCSPLAAPTDRRVFENPETAYGDLVAAASAVNKAELMEIFGENSETLLNSGDEVDDQVAIENFAKTVKDRHEWKQESRALVLHIGEDDWPFPIPLVEYTNGWTFDTEEGLEEILDRKIGANELGALRVCDGYVEAQYEYADKDRTGDGVLKYAEKIISDKGKRNGLYWEGSEEQSPIGPAIAKATREGYKSSTSGEPTPYHGYFYRILKKQGPAAVDGELSYVNSDGKMTEGFALLAYPARWGVSGIMSFIVNYDDEIFEKNLGKDTLQKAKSIESFNPDSSWTKAEREFSE